jgi:hypothetical protein
MHQHISKVLEWGFTPDHNFVATRYGCVLCDATQEKVQTVMWRLRVDDM